MSESKPTIKNGSDYVAIFSGGPFDGQSERRISIDGTWDQQVTMLAEAHGHDAMIDYDATNWREVGDEVLVTYIYDAKDSEKVEDPEDRQD